MLAMVWGGRVAAIFMKNRASLWSLPNWRIVSYSMLPFSHC